MILVGAQQHFEAKVNDVLLTWFEMLILVSVTATF